MEIVEAQDVREVKFDPDTGKPIRDDEDIRRRAARRWRPGTMPPIPPTSTSTGDPTADPKSKELLEDFPVNFN